MRKIVVTEPREMTISNIFLVPLYKIDRSQLVLNGFVNSYLFSDRNIIYDGYVLHLLFQPDDQLKFADFVEVEKRRLGELFLEEYDIEDGVVLVYKIPSIYDKDIETLLKGEYSKLSDTLMRDIPKTVKVMVRGLRKDELHLAHLIHIKSKGLRDFWENLLNIDLPEDAEVWNRFKIEEETLNEHTIKNKFYELTKS